MTTPNMNLAMWMPQLAPNVGEVITVTGGGGTVPYQTQFIMPSGGAGGGGIATVVTGNHPPATPFPGQIWIDTTGAKPLPKIHDGITWVLLVQADVRQSAIPPVNPQPGSVWIDTSNPTFPMMKIWGNGAWTSATGGAADDLARDGTETMQGNLNMDNNALLNVEIDAGQF